MTKEHRKNCIDFLREQSCDFARKVHPIFRMFDWSYHDGKKPSVGDLKDIINRLIDGLEKENVTKSESGRFIVWIRNNELDEESDGNGDCGLKLDIETCGHYLDNRETSLIVDSFDK